jgi:hypothetical protein
MLHSKVRMTGDLLHCPRSTSVANAENWLALGFGALAEPGSGQKAKE